MEEINLLKKLISIPSYVDEDKNADESKLGEYIGNFLASECKWFILSKQKVVNNRFNIIANDGYNPKIIFVCHMDTVKPAGNIENNFQARIVGNKLFGLGASDMKGGIAALLYAIKKVGSTKGVTLIFDCDEEYYFSGIKKLLAEYTFQP